MTPFRIVHTFTADPTRYWKLFFHEPFNEALYERIKVKERKVLDWKDTEKTIYRSIKIVPARDLPGFIKKLVGGDFGYVESSTFYKDKDSIDVVVEPTLFKDRTTVKARYWIEPAGEGKLKRTFEGSIKVDMPLIGKKVEQFIIEDMTRGYEITFEMTNEWLKKPEFS